MPRTTAHDLIHKHLPELNEDELRELRDDINGKLMDSLETHQGSADASADDEKRKYIAQHGAHPNAQETAQSVPSPVSDEAKDLQNEKAREEHMAKGHAADGSH